MSFSGAESCNVFRSSPARKWSGWLNLLPAVQAHYLKAEASSERCLQTQCCKDNNSLWRKVVSQAVNPTFCRTHYPRSYLFFYSKFGRLRMCWREGRLVDLGWPQPLLALPVCWIFKWKLGLRS